eukprot:CAMPEP_0184291664 /NCGR_PEP_ID=MMETSP1049-20130417/3614_1 /TAXON_ID=77928 /ORGANISM="Proteomonas sulcata, Strain CCMP704" /LENGTH=383 /DNA_ID=CAMNT_0026599169 /DNA_START=1 /DNA_END=1152 /DNA_ORIENTATION=-
MVMGSCPPAMGVDMHHQQWYASGYYGPGFGASPAMPSTWSQQGQAALDPSLESMSEGPMRGPGPANLAMGLMHGPTGFPQMGPWNGHGQPVPMGYAPMQQQIPHPAGASVRGEGKEGVALPDDQVGPVVLLGGRMVRAGPTGGGMAERYPATTAMHMPHTMMDGVPPAVRRTIPAVQRENPVPVCEGPQRHGPVMGAGAGGPPHHVYPGQVPPPPHHPAQMMQDHGDFEYEVASMPAPAPMQNQMPPPSGWSNSAAASHAVATYQAATAHKKAAQMSAPVEVPWPTADSGNARRKAPAGEKSASHPKARMRNSEPRPEYVRQHEIGEPGSSSEKFLVEPMQLESQDGPGQDESMPFLAPGDGKDSDTRDELTGQWSPLADFWS